MYAIATCIADITRGTGEPDEFGDPTPADTTVFHGPASITEITNRFWDSANQVPRTIRTLEMLVISTADVRTGDRVHDTTNDRRYVVQDVVQPTGPMLIPDKVCSLKAVG